MSASIPICFCLRTPEHRTKLHVTNCLCGVELAQIADCDLRIPVQRPKTRQKGLVYIEETFRFKTCGFSSQVTWVCQIHHVFVSYLVSLHQVCLLIPVLLECSILDFCNIAQCTAAYIVYV